MEHRTRGKGNVGDRTQRHAGSVDLSQEEQLNGRWRPVQPAIADATEGLAESTGFGSQLGRAGLAALALVIAVVVMQLRQSDWFSRPDFWAEDGSIFFQQAVAQRLWVLRIAALALLSVSLAVGIRLDWKYPSLPPTDFYQVAERFGHAPTGTVAEFPLQPPGWKMTLVKRS
jgi:hypothetical protein